MEEDVVELVVLKWLCGFYYWYDWLMLCRESFLWIV